MPKTRTFAGITAAFAAAVLCFYPLYIDTFANIGQTNFFAFLLLGTGYLFAVCGFLFSGGKPYPARLNAPKQDMTIWGLGLFALANLVSTLLAADPSAAWLGSNSYYGGAVLAVLLALTVVALRCFANPLDAKILLMMAGLSSLLVLGLYLLNQFWIDPLNLYPGIAENSRPEFFSTIGQMDYNGGYFALILPLVFASFCMAEELWETVLWGVLSVLDALALVIVNADTMVIGVTAAVLVLVCLPNFTTTQLRRLLLILAAVFFWAGVMQQLHARFDCNISAGLPVTAQLGNASMLGAPLCLLCWGVLFWAAKKGGAEVKLYKIGRGFAAACAVGLAVLLIAANTVEGFPSLGSLDNLVRFGDAWGTKRGLCWQAVCTVWLKAPLWRKLLGYGYGGLNALLRSEFPNPSDPYLYAFYASHNEFLEQLLSTGLLGLAGWLLFIVGSLRLGFKCLKRPCAAPLALALVGYLVQSFFNVRVAALFPLVMVLFGLLAAVTAPVRVLREPAPKKQYSIGTVWAVRLIGGMAALALCGAFSRILFAEYF